MAKKPKIFVLDTSVILHDHGSLMNFEENYVAIPITVLEELDNFKRGNDIKNYEAREFIRMLDKLSAGHTLQNWISLGEGKGKFKVVIPQKLDPQHDADILFQESKPDHKILNTAKTLQLKHKTQKVILVTKDINLRLKAKAMQIDAEDYKTGKIKDLKKVYTGTEVIDNLPSDIIKKLFTEGYIEDLSFMPAPPIANNYYILKNGNSSSLAFYNPETNRIERVDKTYVYGIKPKNAEQTFAVHALMQPHIKLVTLQGVAGTGKTLLALACALEQRNQFDQIILARPIVPLSNKDIGYLPGDVKDKIGPYMEPLWDNLKFIKSQFGENEKKFQAIEEMQRTEKIVITPLAYIRGRSFSNVFFVVDEAQNLTPHEVKTIITRAGENTKIVFTGDIYQIDTPYLDEHSNGLSYMIERLRGNKMVAHVTLMKGERSELANLANELL
ncbi:MAG: phosphate starvation protein PhoH [Vicingaceae bacterium]|nr:MAG: phosphate starvation protein PhoH [Vicingaceae bacterium]